VLSLFGALSFAELGASIPKPAGSMPTCDAASAGVGFLFGLDAFDRGASRFSRFGSLPDCCGSGDFSSCVAVPFFTWHVSLPWMGKPYDLAFSWAQPLAVVAIAVITFITTWACGSADKCRWR